MRHRPGGAKQMEQNKYELGVIVRADLADDALQAEMDRVKGLLDRFGATIDKVDTWGRRKLAYPIAKKTEGIYTFISYTAPSTTPQEVESRLRLMENVLRFLTINMNDVDIKAAPAPKVEEPKAVEPVAEPTPEPVADEPVAAEPVVEEPAVEEPVAEPVE